MTGTTVRTVTAGGRRSADDPLTLEVARNARSDFDDPTGPRVPKPGRGRQHTGLGCQHVRPADGAPIDRHDEAAWADNGLGDFNDFHVPWASHDRRLHDRPSSTSKKSGKVLLTHEGLSIVMPGTTRPRMAKLIAMRWSS